MLQLPIHLRVEVSIHSIKDSVMNTVVKFFSVLCLVYLVGCEEQAKLNRVEMPLSSFDVNEYEKMLTQIAFDKQVAEENLAWFRSIAIQLAIQLKLATAAPECSCDQMLAIDITYLE